MLAVVIVWYISVVSFLIAFVGVFFVWWLLTLGARAIARKVSDNDA